MKRGRFNIIIGGQAGSESKGKLSGWLCDKYKPDLLVMTSSPNAGHTVVTREGVKKVSYHLPIGSVMCDCPIVLGPASLINLNILRKEVRDLEIDPRRIWIDPRASVITNTHINKEVQGGLSDIGSTLQGIGQCRTNKMKRRDHLFIGDVRVPGYEEIGFVTGDATKLIHTVLANNAIVLCESTQGFDLDLEHGIDRMCCTSKMINPAMIMAEAGIPPSLVGSVYGVIRPYPIRVNNRTGTSGPYAEAPEITWEKVARRCNYPGDLDDLREITTTTELPRRVFEFCWSRFRRFVKVCAPTSLCLQFANYIDWSVYEETDVAEMPSSVWDFIRDLDANSGAMVEFIGTGPGHEHMIDMEDNYYEG